MTDASNARLNWFGLINPPYGDLYEKADPWVILRVMREDLDRATVANRHLRITLGEAIRQLGGELLVSEDQAVIMPLDMTIRTEGNSDTGLVRVWVQK